MFIVRIYTTGQFNKFYSTIPVLKFTRYELFKWCNLISLKMVNPAIAKLPYWVTHTEEKRKKPSGVKRFLPAKFRTNASTHTQTQEKKSLD